MKNRYIAIALLSLSPVMTWSQGAHVIRKEQLVEMFENIAKETKWDMSKPMLWGYFFTDSNKSKLERIVPLLERDGFRFVEIFLADKENKSEPDVWWLHVEKVEIHTPDTLNERNAIFYALADKNGLASYDGMDVGPAEARH